MEGLGKVMIVASNDINEEVLYELNGEVTISLLWFCLVIRLNDEVYQVTLLCALYAFSY